MNRLEELGRVDAEKAYTGKGKRNLRDEKKRIVRELKADGGYITKKKKPSWITKKKKDPSTKPMDPKQKSPKKYITKRSRADIQDKARVKSTRGYRDGGSVMGRGQGRVMRDRPTFMISMKD
jgi:hypothetical protein